MKLKTAFACALGAMTLSSCDNPSARAELRAASLPYNVAAGCYAISVQVARHMNNMTGVSDPEFPLIQQFVNEVAVYSKPDVLRKIQKEGITQEKFESDLKKYETFLKESLTLRASIPMLYRSCSAYAEPETVAAMESLFNPKPRGIEI